MPTAAFHGTRSKPRVVSKGASGGRGGERAGAWLGRSRQAIPKLASRERTTFLQLQMLITLAASAP